MAIRNVGMEVEVTSDTSDAVRGLGLVDAAASEASTGIEKMGREAEESARKVGLTSDAADDFAGKAGKTTGALGALSSGFELVGLGEFATGLQTAAMATDFMSGAGDALNLVMESNAAKFVASKVASLGHSIATGAATVATGAQTAAQWALNAALNANPIGLVVVAVAALVGGLGLAYKKSDTVRGIIKDVGKVGRQAVGWVVDKVDDLVDWFGDKLPGAAGTAKNLVVGYVKLITLPLRTTLDVGKDIVTWVRDKIPNAFDTAKNKAGEIGSALVKPFKDLYDWVKKVLDKIGDIKIPKLPDLNPFNRVFVPGDDPFAGGGFPSGGFPGGGFPPASGGAFIYAPITLSGAILDPDSAARQVTQAVDRLNKRFGG